VECPILAGDRSPGRGDGTRLGGIDHRIDPPDLPRAAENGYAVRSADCDGADAYNPLLLSLGDAARFACILQQCLLPYIQKR